MQGERENIYYVLLKTYYINILSKVAHAKEVFFVCDDERMKSISETEGEDEATGSSFTEIRVSVRKSQVSCDWWRVSPVLTSDWCRCWTRCTPSPAAATPARARAPSRAGRPWSRSPVSSI